MRLPPTVFPGKRGWALGASLVGPHARPLSGKTTYQLAVPRKGHKYALETMGRLGMELSEWDYYPVPLNRQTGGLRFAGWRVFCAALIAALQKT